MNEKNFMDQTKELGADGLEKGAGGAFGYDRSLSDKELWARYKDTPNLFLINCDRKERGLPPLSQAYIDSLSNSGGGNGGW